MKTVFSILVLSFTFFSVKAQNTNQFSDMPSQVSSYISKYFPSQSVVRYKSDVKEKGNKYKVYLNNNTKLKFNHQYQAVKIESDDKLPDNLIPAKILNYVKSNYPNFYIVEWKRKSNKQEVELNNDIELEFDLNDNFLRIDD